VSFAAITLCVASQRVFIVVYFVMAKFGNFWIDPRAQFHPYVDLSVLLEETNVLFSKLRTENSSV
jgi:hypothetical protein